MNVFNGQNGGANIKLFFKHNKIFDIFIDNSATTVHFLPGDLLFYDKALTFRHCHDHIFETGPCILQEYFFRGIKKINGIFPGG